jgi:hypothetical protein
MCRCLTWARTRSLDREPPLPCASSDRHSGSGGCVSVRIFEWTLSNTACSALGSTSVSAPSFISALILLWSILFAAHEGMPPVYTEYNVGTKWERRPSPATLGYAANESFQNRGADPKKKTKRQWHASNHPTACCIVRKESVVPKQ